MWSVEPAARQRRVAMPAQIADRVEIAVDIGEQHALALDRDAFHRAGRNLGDGGDRDKAVGAGVIRWI